MTRIKICGITNKNDAIEAAGLDVDMLGLVFYSKSKRSIEPEAAKDIVSRIPQSMRKVGVFVNGDKDGILRIAESVVLDTLQFHGDESPEFCGHFRPRYKVIKAFRMKDGEDLKKINEYDVDFYLLDTYKAGSAGGTGEVFDWRILKGFKPSRPVILSGGLTPANVAQAIKEVAPYAVDVSTGVEKSPGKKDVELMRRFVENVRRTD